MRLDERTEARTGLCLVTVGRRNPRTARNGGGRAEEGGEGHRPRVEEATEGDRTADGGEGGRGVEAVRDGGKWEKSPRARGWFGSHQALSQTAARGRPKPPLRRNVRRLVAVRDESRAGRRRKSAGRGPGGRGACAESRRGAWGAAGALRERCGRDQVRQVGNGPAMLENPQRRWCKVSEKMRP